MSNTPVTTKNSSKGSRETQREQTRARILQAVLEIVAEQGMRAVRHRAVADRAGVSLGSTTYHFSSIEDLIVSAFDYFNKQQMMTINPYYLEVREQLQKFDHGIVPEALRPEVAAWICDQSVKYVCDQVGGSHFDRIVEFAFYHESIRYPALRELLITVRQTELEFLTQLHRAMGSQHPVEDARITVSLFRQLEQSVITAVAPGLDSNVIRRTIERHLSMCLNIPLSPASAVED